MSFGAPDFPQPPINRKEQPKIKCSKCGEECKIHSSEVSDCGGYQVQWVECTGCKHSATVVSKRIGAPSGADMIV